MHTDLEGIRLQLHAIRAQQAYFRDLQTKETLRVPASLLGLAWTNLNNAADAIERLIEFIEATEVKS